MGPAASDNGLNPALSPAQLARIAAEGESRQVHAGQTLIRRGDPAGYVFVVVTGRVEAVRRLSGGEEVIASFGPGTFTGEANLLTGRRAFVEVRAAERGEVIALERRRLLGLIQTDDELSDLFMRAFVLRRARLIAAGVGNAVVLGSSHSQGTLRVREFLTRNGYPYAFINLDTDSGVQELLDHFQVQPLDIPVVICSGRIVLRNPSNREIADCLGFNEAVDVVRLRDLVVVGAGPAGLAAAVYGASEGLDVLVLEATASGGQAGTSSRIENYLGFPTGISGADLATRAYAQALKFGAQIMVAAKATHLACDATPYAVELEDADRVPTRAVIIATGATYRRLPIRDLHRFEGAGIYYAATPMEAQLCAGEEVIVIGGGNSAGQAAVFLSEHARRVHVVIRSSGLADTMSRYLIRRIEEHDAIELHVHTEIASLEGNDHLERVGWRDNGSGHVESRDIRHVFSMTGAVPSTAWLAGCLALDDKGFIKTGPALSREELEAAHWRPARSPYLLETSLPGVFAVGDVRAGSLKRVASAVGEGSIAIAAVHHVLAQA